MHLFLVYPPLDVWSTTGRAQDEDARQTMAHWLGSELTPNTSCRRPNHQQSAKLDEASHDLLPLSPAVTTERDMPWNTNQGYTSVFRTERPSVNRMWPWIRERDRWENADTTQSRLLQYGGVMLNGFGPRRSGPRECGFPIVAVNQGGHPNQKHRPRGGEPGVWRRRLIDVLGGVFRQANLLTHKSNK